MPISKFDIDGDLKPSMNEWFDNHWNKEIKKQLAKNGPTAVKEFDSVKWCEELYEYFLDEMEGILFEAAIRLGYETIEDFILSLTNYREMLEEKDSRRALYFRIAITWNAMTNIGTGLDSNAFFKRKMAKKNGTWEKSPERLQERINELEQLILERELGVEDDDL